MKLNRANIFITISSLALLMVLVIQVNWILQTARIKEELFNEKANIVLARTADALSNDTGTCKKIDACIEKDRSFISADKLGKSEAHKIDSLLTHYMNFYHFHMGYSFVVVKPKVADVKNNNSFSNYINTDQQGCYKKALAQVANEKGLELKLLLPQKKQFIMAELGKLFITSVILILIVLVMFWRTVLSLIKERKISDHTTDFLNNMTHEFKTPLTNIALAAKMIIKDPTIKHEDKIKHYSGIILEENEKLRLQVEQVLSMTALERGEIPIHKTELDFHVLINDSLKCISIQIENKQGNMQLNLKAGNSVIMGDKTHLTNAMCNLVDNAIKYSKVKPELYIQTSNSGQNLVIVVSDNGVGIEKQYHKKVFDKFFRISTGDVHEVRGFGLGLAYIKKIVELHEGIIELKSEKGKGTTFTITLPHA